MLCIFFFFFFKYIHAYAWGYKFVTIMCLTYRHMSPFDLNEFVFWRVICFPTEAIVIIKDFVC